MKTSIVFNPYYGYLGMCLIVLSEHLCLIYLCQLRTLTSIWYIEDTQNMFVERVNQ